MKFKKFTISVTLFADPVFCGSGYDDCSFLSSDNDGDYRCELFNEYLDKENGLCKKLEECPAMVKQPN